MAQILRISEMNFLEERYKLEILIQHFMKEIENLK